MGHQIVVRGRWQLWTSVLLHRLPVVSATPSSIETQMAALMRAREDENSLLSRHELRNKEDIKKALALKELGETIKMKNVQQKADNIGSQDETILLTAREQELLWQREAAAHVAANRYSSNNSNLESLNRQLERVLILLEKSTAEGIKEFSSAATWRLPASPLLTSDKNLIDSAHRVLLQLQGESLKDGNNSLRMLGNMPWAIYTYTYGKHDDKNLRQGVKMFVYKAQIMDARRSLLSTKPIVKVSNESVEQTAWVTRDELLNLAPYACKRYARFLHQCVSEY